jgi:sugar phosphate isomerase/epimerase
VRLALSEISTVNASFAEDVVSYAAAGFDAIGLWEFKLPDDDAANRALLRAHGLAVANCVPAVPSLLQLGIPGMEGPADPAERVDAICASVRRLAQYEPECVVCITGPLGDLTETEARAVVTDGLRRIAAAARAAGTVVGFEPIHPSERETTSFVNTIADAVALRDDAGVDEVGILVDTYNLAEDDASVEWIAAHPARIAGVHVAAPSDAGPGRALPSGRAGERTLVEALRAAGWDGSLDVEIFSTPDGFWSLPADEAARRAYAAAAPLLV